MFLGSGGLVVRNGWLRFGSLLSASFPLFLRKRWTILFRGPRRCLACKGGSVAFLRRGKDG